MALHEEGNTSAAQQELLKLAKQHPRNKSVLLALLELSQKLQDWRTYAFMVGDFAQAIATAESVLAQDPDNFHALGNLVRYSVLTAQFAQARQFAQRLEQCASDNPDLATKQAEAFAFLGVDEKVQTVYQRALAQGSHLSPLLLHLAATAAYRLGDEKSAWQLWQKAVKQMPTLEMARSSLAERRVPPGKRNIPWYWPFAYWFPQDMEQLLDKHLGQKVIHKKHRPVKITWIRFGTFCSTMSVITLGAE